MMPPEDSGMDDSLYSDGKSSDAADEKSAPQDSVDEKAAETPTALLPLSALGGKAKPGDTVTMKVVKLHGDEVEVEISSSSDEAPDKEPATDPEELGELDKMGA